MICRMFDRLLHRSEPKPVLPAAPEPVTVADPHDFEVRQRMQVQQLRHDKRMRETNDILRDFHHADGVVERQRG